MTKGNAVSTSTSRALGLVPRKTRYGIVAIIVLLGLWWAIGALGAPARMSSELHSLVSERPHEYVDIEIAFHAGPTRFHLDRYQQEGQLGRVDGNVLVLRRVEGSQVTRIARDYWIERIDVHHP